MTFIAVVQKFSSIVYLLLNSKNKGEVYTSPFIYKLIANIFMKKTIITIFTILILLSYTTLAYNELLTSNIDFKKNIKSIKKTNSYPINISDNKTSQKISALISPTMIII